MKPKQLRGLRLLPPAEVLVERLHEVERQLADLQARQAQGLEGRSVQGVQAHIAALQRRRHWYLARIRTTRPVEALNVSVAETVSSRDGMG